MSPSDLDWPRCACGCGEPVPVRKASVPSKGLKIGEPCKFVRGHSARSRAKLPILGTLLCSQCGIAKSVEDYHKDSNRANGYHPRCKVCQKESAARWYVANRERVIEESTAYHAANPEVGRRAQAKFVKTAKGRVNALRQRTLRRGATRKAKSVDPLVVLERADGNCGICGDAVDPEDFHVDHVFPLSRGGEHTYANTQPAHPFCNRSKGAKVVV